MPLLDAVGIWIVWFMAHIFDKHYKPMLNTIHSFSLKGKGKEKN